MSGDGAGGDGSGADDTGSVTNQGVDIGENPGDVSLGSQVELAINSISHAVSQAQAPTENPAMNAALRGVSSLPGLNAVVAVGTIANMMGAEPTGTGSTPGDESGADVGTGSAADAAGAVGEAPLFTPAAPLPPAPPPPAAATPVTPAPVSNLIPLPKISADPVLDPVTEAARLAETIRTEDADRRTDSGRAAAKIVDEVEDLSRQRFLTGGGALGLRGTRGLTLARPEAFGALRLGQ